MIAVPIDTIRLCREGLASKGRSPAATDVECIKSGDDGSVKLNVAGKLGLVRAEVFGKQVVAQVEDRRATGLVPGFDCQVAFGVQPFGAIVEVGRANPDEAIVDDHHLGMNEDLFLAAVPGRNHGIAGAQATVSVGPSEPGARSAPCLRPSPVAREPRALPAGRR